LPFASVRPLWRTTLLGVVALAIGAAPGCVDPAARQDSARLTIIRGLEDKVEQQARLVAQKDDQLRDLSGTIQSLRELDGDRTLDQLVHVSKIEIVGLSGGDDTDHDGLDEGVVVHLRPLDQFGGALRASGMVRVRLLDLSVVDGAKELGRIELGRADLEATWYGGLLNSHYTIRVPWASGAKRPPTHQATVLVSFTDLLSARTFEDQTVVTLSGAAP
jgi:hypothetical protein